MIPIHHRTTTVDGQRVFYRQAGPHGAPTVVLLHGFPTSSHEFRDLIPALADRYHVIAPDYIGFGYSAAPPVTEFDYTFAKLTTVTAGLLDQLGIVRYALYVHDYGAPIGWRLAVDKPEAVSAIVTQNGNAYVEGFVESFWSGLFAYASDPSPEHETLARNGLKPESIRWQYLNGVSDPTLVSPDAWSHAEQRLAQPGNDLAQLALFRDYVTNVSLYPKVHEYFRTSQVPLLAVWGSRDEIFGPAGARAFATDLPEAEIHLLDTGHFALETHLDAITGYMRGFLGRTFT